MNYFTYSNSHIWDWSQNRFVGADALGSQSIKGFLANAYQYYRYDFTNSDFTYGITESILNRYDAAIVAVEPGGEQNWHPPAMRAQITQSGRA